MVIKFVVEVLSPKKTPAETPSLTSALTEHTVDDPAQSERSDG